MSTPLRAVVVGAGSIGRRHLGLLRAHDNVEVTALPSRPSSVEPLRAQGMTAASSWDDVGSADLVVVATDTGRHAADLREAIARGATTVLVEKPLVASAEQLEVPVGAQVFVGYNLRFAETVGRVQDLLGSLGEIHAAELRARSWLPSWRPDRDLQASYSARPDEGGVLRDLSHEIDLALWLFGTLEGTPQGSVRCTGRLGIEADDIATLCWSTSTGAEVAVGLDYLTRPASRGLVAHGAGGRVEMDLLAGTVTFTDVVGATMSWSVAKDDVVQTYGRQLDELLEVARGKPPRRLATWDDGRRVVELTDVVRERSAWTSRSTA